MYGWGDDRIFEIVKEIVEVFGVYFDILGVFEYDDLVVSIERCLLCEEWVRMNVEFKIEFVESRRNFELCRNFF